MAYQTSNQEWWKSKNSADVIPDPPESEDSDLLWHYAKLVMISQGPDSGRRFGMVYLDWQRKLIQWLVSVEEIGLKCSKGSGKSATCAVIALSYLFYCAAKGKFNRSEITILSSGVETAKIVFNHVLNAIILDDHIRDEFKTNVVERSITHVPSQIVIKVRVPRLRACIGVRPILAIFDELHVACLESEFRQCYDQITLGGANFGSDFKQVIISTAPPKPIRGFYNDWLNRMRKCQRGIIECPSTLAAVFEWPHEHIPDVDIMDQSYWHLCLPSLRQHPGSRGTMSAETLIREIRKNADEIDEGIGGAEENYRRILSQFLGVEPLEIEGSGLTYLSEIWPDHTVPELPGWPPEITIASFDPSSALDDPFFMVLLCVFGDLSVAFSKGWILDKGFERSPDWLKDIYLEAVKAEEMAIVKDTDTIEHEIHQYCKGLPMGTHYGGDGSGLSGFHQRLNLALGVEYIPIKQGWTLHSAYQGAMANMISGKLKHMNQPFFNFASENLRVDGLNFRKADSALNHHEGWKKIDPMMCLFSAIEMRDVHIPPPIDVSCLIG